MSQIGQRLYLALLDARQNVLIVQEDAVDTAIASLLAKVNFYHAFNACWSYALTRF
jgi:multidrug efflux system outer membrane protein